MPNMTAEYREAIADYGGTLITHIGLVDEDGYELEGGDPTYARQVVTWTSADDGTIRPTADLTFDVPADTTVAGWRAYASVTGDTPEDADDYGGKALTQETFANQGEYKLLAASTGILHDSPS